MPIVLGCFPVTSVADFGCGQGSWLNVWKRLGATRIRGLDGKHVDPCSLLIDSNEFTPADLSQRIDLSEHFDLVQSLEVAEHIPPSSASIFVDNLLRHGGWILFSAATPGQIGVHHVNERPYEYWRDLFAQRNYAMLDIIRPMVMENNSVQWWYRYNTFVFVKQSDLDSLPPEVRDCHIDVHDTIADISPTWHKAVKFFTRHLSVNMSTRLASWSIRRYLKKARTGIR